LNKKITITPEEMLQAVQRSAREVMEGKGLGLEYLVGLLKKELTAKETSLTINKKTGDVTTTHHPIWPIRQKARQDAHKLRGDYPAEKLEVGGLEQTLFNLGQEELDKRIRLLDAEAAAFSAEMGTGSETVQ